MREDLNPISLPENLRRAIDLEEVYGHPKENIKAIMDPNGWDLEHLDNFETPRISKFELACGESVAWVEETSKFGEYDLLQAIRTFDIETLEAAPIAINLEYRSGDNPLMFALSQEFPIRFTLLILALLRQYGSGGESVNISSDLPPKPPSPAHWGGRRPGFEQPIPFRDQNLDIGEKRPKR